MVRLDISIYMYIALPQKGPVYHNGVLVYIIYNSSVLHTKALFNFVLECEMETNLWTVFLLWQLKYLIRGKWIELFSLCIQSMYKSFDFFFFWQTAMAFVSNFHFQQFNYFFIIFHFAENSLFSIDSILCSLLLC